MLILSPQRVERLESFMPEICPMPKIFRLTKKGELYARYRDFKRVTINTPSMMAVDDYINVLVWEENVRGNGGLR